MRRVFTIGEKVWYEEDHECGWGTLALVNHERDYLAYTCGQDEILTIEKNDGGEIECTADNVYQVAAGRYFWGELVCWEHNEDIDYPFFCPTRYENCYHFEVEEKAL